MKGRTDIASDAAGTPQVDRGDHDGRHGDMLLAISNAVVGIYKECFGKGPTKARTYHYGDVITCILRGGYTRMEATLLDSGHPDVVQRQRHLLQQAARDRFVAAVEEITGRRVTAFISGTDHGPDVHAEIFVLESEDGPEKSS
jgi:uncharacterized protein YbcI